MRWRVDWNMGDWAKTKAHGPRQSDFWTLGGYVVATTPALKHYLGWTRHDAMTTLTCRGLMPRFVDHSATPATLDYHKHLLATCNALVGLLDQNNSSATKGEP